jgi:RND superfamily putative drug exporter
MVLVPATMTLLGRWNWWLPAWLDRLLPSIDTEKHDASSEDVWTEFDAQPDKGELEKVEA